MTTQIFLGKPPANIEAWIKKQVELKTPLYFKANESGASVAMRCWDEYNY